MYVCISVCLCVYVSKEQKQQAVMRIAQYLQGGHSHYTLQEEERKLMEDCNFLRLTSIHHGPFFFHSVDFQKVFTFKHLFCFVLFYSGRVLAFEGLGKTAGE